MKKWIPWLVVAVFAGWIVSSLRTRPETGFDTRGFGKLPVLLNGRIQPLDSVARNSLLQLRTRQSVVVTNNERLTATQWLLETLAEPEVADTRKVFRIDNLEMLGMLNLPEHEKYFSFHQLQPGFDELHQEATRIDKIETAERTAFERQVMKLYQGMMLYQRLKMSLRPTSSDDFAAELNGYEKAIEPGVAAVDASQTGKDYDKEAYNRILGYLASYQDLAKYAYILAIPPVNGSTSHNDWKNIGTSLMESVRGGGINPAAKYYAAMMSSYRHDNPTGFNQAVASYRQWLGGKFMPEIKKGQEEFFFNHFQPFYKAMIIYMLAFLGACAFWFNWAPWLRRSAFYLMILAWVIHTFGLIFRMYLEGRPPVTNLYSSAIFIGWGAVVLGMTLEWIYRDGIGIVVGSLIGFVTQVIAHNLALGGDTMEMLRAVLDTNFWLATHVVVVTLGYASTFFAGLLAIIYIVRGVFTKSLTSATAKSLSRMVYGIICFATLFSFVGTVLGGIWADQSWGRFWGWDPKENGALLIVIWNALILHARWGGMVRERGIMNLAVAGNIVTSFSWFGVNLLGIGLHSYGFSDSGSFWLYSVFMPSQVLLIAVGCLPLRFWKSFQKQDVAPAGKSKTRAQGASKPAAATTG